MQEECSDILEAKIAERNEKAKKLYRQIDYEPILEDWDTEDVPGNPQSDEDIQFGRYVLYQCLIYLGDLSRYQVEILHNFEPSTAARYYLQAAHIDMCSGMPFNQLGNLYLDKNYNLDSVCYYIHCLSCTTPFEGASGNLAKILEKQMQYAETLNDTETYTQTEHIQNTVANFLSLIDIWYFSKNDTNVPQRCNKIAHELKIAMEFVKSPLPDMNKDYEEYVQAIEEENTNPSYLTGKAFTLALLSQLLQKLQKQLEELGFKNPSQKYRGRTVSVNDVEPEKVERQDDVMDEKSVTDEIIITNPLKPAEIEIDDTKEMITDDDSKKLQNGNSKLNSKKVVAKRRRRRRMDSSDSSELSDADTESSEMTTDEASSDDDDVVSNSTDKSDDSRSEGSICNGSDGEHIAEEHTEDVEIKETQPVKNDNIEVNGKDNNHKKHMKETAPGNNPLKEEEIQNFLLGDNFLPNYAKHIAKKLKLEYKKIPLPEDLNLRGTNICKFDKDAAEWQILDKYKPSVYEENVETSEGGLLRRLGRLWLTSQVRELERSGRAAAGPALLALDAAALHSHLRRVKQLLRARSFVLLVPAVVLQELDDLKREKSGARDAIRWLEVQLRSGSRFLRAQRPGQSRPLPLLKYPKKAPPT
ncbi:hypothetical protein MSG28_012365 [Choristoneura fumiferana]|uniref:Uncharacterized protein n=1 Tax=Choristoneura fumiferana TaxID=7141 RepID=A0ACC0KD83_CHOFU|nr:hypothetical protein MSG28_012365 [Choristoneura fumiferana]